MMINLVNVNAPSVELAVTDVSGSAALTTGYGFVLIDNTLASNNHCFVKSGLSTVTATTSDMHIAPGEKATYQIDPDHTHLAAICSSGGTTTLRLVRGAGV